MYFVEKSENKISYKKIDCSLFLPVLFLSIFGMFVVRSATITRTDGGVRIMFMQGMGLIIGIIAAIIINSLDYRELKSIARILYFISCILLIMVLIIGRGDQYGSRSWINVGGISFQPAELAKISFILVISEFLENIMENPISRFDEIVKICVFSAIPILLVVIQKDFGTTCVFLAILFIMLFVGGLKIKYVVGMFLSFLATTPFIWNFLLNDKRRDRIRVFLNPELDPLGAGMNVLRSKMTIGSGKIFGKGLFHGIQTQNSAVPVKESDFIFSVIGEETGFIMSALVVLIFLFIILRCVYIAQNSRDAYGTFIVMGFVAMIGVHIIENIGMTIGLLPVTGIPLPFISQGGTAMITNYIAIGFILSVSRRKNKKGKSRY